MNDSTEVRELVASTVGATGGPIVALSRIVAARGCITADHIAIVADVFNLSVAEVRGIVSFYGDLTTVARGATDIRICQAEACQAVGARAFTAAVEQRYSIGLGATSADGRVSVGAVYCLGVCASGPAAMIDGVVRVGLSAGAMDELAAAGVVP